jgi:hypothetical protein
MSYGPASLGAFFKKNMKSKKTFLVILSAILSLSGLFLAKQVRADSYYQSVEFIALPSDNNTSAGYLNLLSTGFRVDINLAADYAPESLKLYLDDCINPIDTELYDTATNYILSSGTATHLELNDLLGHCSASIPGIHHIYLKGVSAGGGELTIWQDEFSADFNPLTGSFQASSLSGRDLLKVGDKVTFSFSPNKPDDKSIEATIYGRELTFEKIGSLFKSIYTIQEGDSDLTGSITLNNVKITDLANNLTTYSLLDIPISFSIDANSPELVVISPENRGYNTRDIQLEYQASGYDELKFYLDGREIEESEFSNLLEGDHQLRVVAEDLAGNAKEVIVNFQVDITAPTGTLINPPSSITEGEKLSLQGQSEPEAIVRIEIEGNTLEKVAGLDGSFSFDIEGLSTGEHEIYLTFIDPLGNENRILALKILVNAKSVVLEEGADDETTVSSEPVELALADTAPDDMSDVQTGLNLENLPALVQEEDGVISEFGQTSQRSSSQAWLFLGIIVVFSVFLSAISYNFYSKLAALKSLSNENVNQEYINEEQILKNAIKDSAPEFKEPETKTDPEEPKETLRW